MQSFPIIVEALSVIKFMQAILAQFPIKAALPRPMKLIWLKSALKSITLLLINRIENSCKCHSILTARLIKSYILK